MNRTLLMLVAGLTGLQPAAAEEVQQVIAKLQDRLNSRALSSVLGKVDYEYVYSTTDGEGVLLEEVGAAAVAQVDTATTSSVRPAEVVARTGGRMEIVRLDTVRTAGRKDSVIVHMREIIQEPTSPPLPTQRMTKSQLPVELRQADVGALKARLRPPVEANDRMLYLGVRAATEDPRYPGERLSLAESELSLPESRQLRWDLQEVFGHWPAGSVLCLEYTGTVTPGEAAEVPLRWSFQRPSQTPPFDRTEVLASGAAALSLRKVGEEWKVSHVERLIGALHAGVVKR